MPWLNLIPNCLKAGTSSQSKYLTSLPFPLFSFLSSNPLMPRCIILLPFPLNVPLPLHILRWTFCFGNNNYVDCCSDGDDMDEKNTAPSCACVCVSSWAANLPRGCGRSHSVCQRSSPLSTQHCHHPRYCHHYCHVIIIIIFAIVIVIVGCCS